MSAADAKDLTRSGEPAPSLLQRIRKPRGFATWSPERRQEALKKANETRARNAQARKDAKSTRRGGKRETAPVRKGPSKAVVAGWLRLGIGVLAGNYPIEIFEDPKKDPAFAALSSDEQAEALAYVEEQKKVEQEILAALRSWIPPVDRFSKAEVDLASDAASEEITRIPPAWLARFEKLAAIGQGMRLPAVILALALPRLVNHHVVPRLLMIFHRPLFMMAARGRVKGGATPKPTVAAPPEPDETIEPTEEESAPERE